MNLIEQARALINQNLPSTTLSTTDRDYNVNVAVISVLEMVGDDTILMARFGAERTYENLKETGKGAFLVLTFDDAGRKNGVRVYVTLTADETCGERFDRLVERLGRTPYHTFPLKNCLVFTITSIQPVSTLGAPGA